MEKTENRIQIFHTQCCVIGLDDLKERAVYFKKGGCQFAKWRCVYVISEVTPSRKVLKENAKTLAQYAISSQQAGLVPIIEPEVIFMNLNCLLI